MLTLDKHPQFGTYVCIRAEAGDAKRLKLHTNQVNEDLAAIPATRHGSEPGLPKNPPGLRRLQTVWVESCLSDRT